MTTKLTGICDMSNLTKAEKSLLLYFETQATDYGGTLEGARMNAEDFAIARHWNEFGFVRFGRIAFADIKKLNGVARDHWCVLSDDAWRLAHIERRERCERVAAKLTVTRLGLEPKQ